MESDDNTHDFRAHGAHVEGFTLSKAEEYLLDEYKFILDLMMRADTIYSTWETWFILAQTVLVAGVVSLITARPGFALLVTLACLLGASLSLIFWRIIAAGEIYAVVRYRRIRRIEGVLTKKITVNGVQIELFHLLQSQEQSPKIGKLHRSWGGRKMVPFLFFIFWLLLPVLFFLFYSSAI